MFKAASQLWHTSLIVMSARLALVGVRRRVAYLRVLDQHGRCPLRRKRSWRTKAVGGSRTTSKVDAQRSQSTATSRALQSCRILTSPRRPIRSVRALRPTLSIESKLATQCRGTGSSPGSRTTSLGKPRTVVVHGAMAALRRRGMAASRDNTTTGLRPMSGSSHHQTSPRAGNELKTRLLKP